MVATRLIALCGALLFAASASPTAAQVAPPDPGFLHARGTGIVDGQGRPIILRGMGLGGWVLQEGYMLQLPELGQQHVIRARIAGLIGEEKTAAFYAAWRANYVTKADIDAMGRWGFNSVRVPLHYDQLTLPADREPTPGADTWNEAGFRQIDELIGWVKANNMVLILDLHAAPGGQGTDLAISDRDPSKPSLWDSPENRRKTVALWRKLAERYANEPAVGAYDIINEPNWDFEKPGGGHGCEETTNAPLRSLMMEITAAIREVDQRHLIVIEGNCWGNNYHGVLPVWDDNMALSFHKYWNANDAASIADIVKLRDENQIPIWLGESGENSNTWFRDAIRLVEDQNIGWAFWPLKKIGFNQPLEVVPNPGWAALVAYLTGKGPAPTPAEAEATLMRMAQHDIRFENNTAHPDVIDAMLRQPHSDETRPFADHRVGSGPAVLPAADYDLGRAGHAWFDTRDASYETPSQRIWWNTGRTYRNDGVDIAREPNGAPYVTDFVTGEWLRYTVTAEAAGERTVTMSVRSATPGRLSVSLNGAAAVEVEVPASSDWQEVETPALPFMAGSNVLILKVKDCGGCAVKSVMIKAAP
ncbi:MAG: glycosyl hydrolase family 5 [Caulobacteraceae bacterium]|nr:glycosyl hydrolase family 5 [Caulobacteraceae bacterium]